MRSLLPLLLISGCVTVRGTSLESECLRLLRCEVAWSARDVASLIHEDCDNPKGFSMGEELKRLAGVSSLDCVWNRGIPPVVDETEPN